MSNVPTSAAIREQMKEVLLGNVTREAAADWARPWIAELEEEVEDLYIFDALKDLAGVDLMVSPNQYLHSLEDIREWVERLDKESGAD